MATFPIGETLEESVENALEAGYRETGTIAGQLLQYHSESATPTEIQECVERAKSKHSRNDPISTDDAATQSVSDQELRAALEEAGVSGESTGELPG